jgi:hypothetical protein
MKLTTSKLEAGVYIVWLDGVDTRLCIIKGDAPKYRHPQQWGVFAVFGADSSYDCLFGDQDSLEGARRTIERMFTVCVLAELGAKK